MAQLKTITTQAESPTIAKGVIDFTEGFDFAESSNTRVTYTTGLNAFLDFVESTGVKPTRSRLSSLEPSIVPAFATWLRKGGYSRVTIHIYQAALRRAVRYWRAKKWIRFTEADAREAASAMRIRTHKTDSGAVRANRVPLDFGERLLKEAWKIEIPPTPSPEHPEWRIQRLAAYRARALVAVLDATALRVSDVCRLTRAHLREAIGNDGYLRLPMKKTGRDAMLFFGDWVIKALEDYLRERGDTSPWLFIQHGKSGRVPAKHSEAMYRSVTRGYGAHISTWLAWSIIHDLCKRAKFKKSEYATAHAFRHWHAKANVARGVPLEVIQEMLGHQDMRTTKQYSGSIPRDKFIELERTFQERFLPFMPHSTAERVKQNEEVGTEEEGDENAKH